MYFQNVSDGEFLGNLLLSDRQFTMTFKIKGNSPNSSQLFQSCNPELFNVTSPNNNLTLNYSFDSGSTWTILTIDVSTYAVTPTAAKAFEIVAALSANATFQALFTASVDSDSPAETTVSLFIPSAPVSNLKYMSPTVPLRQFFVSIKRRVLLNCLSILLDIPLPIKVHSPTP